MKIFVNLLNHHRMVNPLLMSSAQAVATGSHAIAKANRTFSENENQAKKAAYESQASSLQGPRDTQGSVPKQKP